jgi:hypothetical protein
VNGYWSGCNCQPGRLRVGFPGAYAGGAVKFYVKNPNGKSIYIGFSALNGTTYVNQSYIWLSPYWQGTVNIPVGPTFDRAEVWSNYSDVPVQVDAFLASH